MFLHAWLQKNIFYDGISVFINKTPKIYKERNHFDFLSPYWFHKPWPNYGDSLLEGWLSHFVWVSLIWSGLGNFFFSCFPSILSSEVLKFNHQGSFFFLSLSQAFLSAILWKLLFWAHSSGTNRKWKQFNFKKKVFLTWKLPDYFLVRVLKMIRGGSGGMRPNGNRRQFLSFLFPGSVMTES